LIQKILIANRGEIAVRIIHACHEMGIRTVAVYSDADANAKHVQMADEAYYIGASTPQQSYLDIDKLIAIARSAQVDAIHPGYGFLSESPIFAQHVQDEGFIWIGPNPTAIEQMGIKTQARSLMQDAGVPIVPGFQADNATLDDYMQAGNQIGYPIMVKAAGGGGGKGIRIVYDESELANAIESAMNEARKSFDDDRIFLERYIEHGRHIEVQVLADTHGNTVYLFERECSTQRRHQKIIEEAPSPLITPELRQQIGESAVAAAKAVNYINAGTVEFIATEQGEFFFLEMNTRLQVEHPVTEMITGLDLVQLQIRIAQGESLPFTQDDLGFIGHSIECRIYAEDAHNNFLPAIGKVEQFIPCTAPKIRTDSGIQSGDEITIHYDPMIAKLIVHAQDRTSAIERMKHALHEIVILGTTTNVDFLLALLNDEAFIEGRIHTRYVDENLEHLLPEQAQLPPLVLIATALSEQLKTTSSTETQTSDAQNNDPWARTDNFRMNEV